jgi:hypothetical protein
VNAPAAFFRSVFLHVANQLALCLDATPPGTYRQWGASSLKRLFRTHFPQLVARYEAEFAKRLGKFRLERITKAVERFLGCGDYNRASPESSVPTPIAEPTTFGPSVAASSKQLLLRLPHRQFVFTLPKVLRVFFRHDKRLHGQISRLVYGLVRDFLTAAAGSSIRVAASSSRWSPFATAGENHV